MIVRPARRSFAERYRLVRSKWNEEWWSVAFGGPIANLLNGLFADVAWITPNRITILSFLCKIVAVPLLLAGAWRADVAAVVILELNTVFDCMDGALARYRKQSSAMGAFLDKITDLVGLCAVLAAVGWRAYQGSGDARVLLVALLTAASFVVRGYVFWVVAHLERERKVERPSVGGDDRIDASALTVKQRAWLYLKSMPRVIAFAESDLYFWIGLGVLTSRLRETIYLIGIAAAVWFVINMAYRLYTVSKLDPPR
jgi:phosphatidylglycerophosphate synthase